MTMLASVLLTAVAATLEAPAATPPPPPPPPQARAQTQVLVRIIQAAEVRGGLSDVPHQRSIRRDELGRSQILLQFE